MKIRKVYFIKASGHSLIVGSVVLLSINSSSMLKRSIISSIHHNKSVRFVGFVR